MYTYTCWNIQLHLQHQRDRRWTHVDETWMRAPRAAGCQTNACNYMKQTNLCWMLLMKCASEWSAKHWFTGGYDKGVRDLNFNHTCDETISVRRRDTRLYFESFHSFLRIYVSCPTTSPFAWRRDSCFANRVPPPYASSGPEKLQRGNSKRSRMLVWGG